MLLEVGVCAAKQLLQLVELLVVLLLPLAAKSNHFEDCFAILFELLFEGAFEICWVKPRYIIFR